MLRGFRLVYDSRYYLSIGASMKNNVRRTSHNEIRASVSQVHNGNLQTKMFHFSQLNSSRLSERLGIRIQNCSTASKWRKENFPIDTSRMPIELEEAQTFFNKQEWKSAYNKFFSLRWYLFSSHEIHGNLAVSAFQFGFYEAAEYGATFARDLCPRRLVYHELVVQALIKQKSYTEALEVCDEALAIDSKILEGNDSDVEELKKLKQYCIKKINAELDGNQSEADDFPFRQFLQGFISQDAVEKIATTAVPFHP